MSEQAAVGRVTRLDVRDGYVEISAPPAQVRVVFLTDDLLRIWMAPDGDFTDPADTAPPSGEPGAGMVVKSDYPATAPELADAGDHYRLATPVLTLRVHKDPLRFGLWLRHPDGDDTLVVEETRSLTWNGAHTAQYLTRGAGEQFFGGGMQNGRFAHRATTVDVEVSYDWNDGGCPNSVPFYCSTAGYGVLRNTFAPGSYRFTEPVRTRHEERRFDAYYFVGPPKQVIDRYTELTGRPFMPPIYGLEMGDADCYLCHQHRGERHTLDALKVADGYVEREIPLGWMLVNDGYGCGYEDLDQVAGGLADRHIQLGLWTSTGLPDQADEVRRGARVRKLDIAWTYPGYRFGLDACRQAYRGIEDHCDSRGFVWSAVGWAGSQRYAVHWSGDQHGSWEYIRWQIPTYAGATLSGLAHTAGDVDGIHSGSPETYTRDLQWKSFLPVAMTMSGWADVDKQPWRHGEPYTAINRRYIQLRERLLPYFYTYSAGAHRHGLGMVRPLALEYPDDPATLGDEARYQFLAGDAFLVAPVYTDAAVRDGIYLPVGTWTDYWSGERHAGPVRLRDHPAPLDRLPLFVKGGSIVPMWPEGTLSWATRDTGRLDLDVYPEGVSDFTLYEDDGVTRGYARGEYSTQRFTAAVAADRTEVTIGAIAGDYAGRPEHRRYLLRVHGAEPPAGVAAGDTALARHPSPAAFDAAASGWYFDPGIGGVTVVQTPPVRAGAALTITLDRLR
ncbi:MAG TPA: TIM-barrel domain-containing protein [Acidimicrobiia bacterium]|nr:TIM-barrel domain-containing protein [Acidimicrobiia bacterium]